MLLSHGSWRFRRRTFILSVILFTLISWWLFVGKQGSSRSSDLETLAQRFPLAWKHIHSFNGTGGAWFIPPEWIDSELSQPRTIVEAARLASDAAKSNYQRQIAFSNIPLLVHQTWKTTRIDTWNIDTISWVEQWLECSISSERSRMAYFFWDDEGVLAFMRQFEPDFLEAFIAYFTPVERADIFRILVCKWFGGVYDDIDTEPLQPPATWVRPSDIAAWTDEVTGASYGHSIPPVMSQEANLEQPRPVNMLWGLEADTDPESDSYWRMGYTYPVQLTQWALASAPQHPVLSLYMDILNSRINEAKKETLNSANIAAATKKELRRIDPLILTGPAAVTLSTKTWLENQVGLRWSALTGLKDGGKAKLVADVLILPITAFSPGRGVYGNMGSKPITDPDARLYHHAQGSWHHFDLVVEYGKFCRAVFGLCRNWSKVPAQDEP